MAYNSKIVNDIENSPEMQSIHEQYKNTLDPNRKTQLRSDAQSLRAKNGYTANEDGSQFSSLNSNTSTAPTSVTISAPHIAGVPAGGVQPQKTVDDMIEELSSKDIPYYNENLEQIEADYDEVIFS